MLKELIVSHFGKFRDRRFALAPTTVFFGPNEAGKTTLFDALFMALCRPPATRRAGKLLRDRYGTAMESSLEFAGEEIRLDEEEFRNLHAIRSGDVAADLPGGARWVEKVRAGLFNGGLDPAVLADRLERRTRSGAGLTHNRERARYEGDLERASAHRDELRQKRDRILSGEKTVLALRAELGRIVDRLARAREDLAEINAEIDAQECAKDRIARESLLNDLDLIKELERRLGTVVSADTAGYDRLEAAHQAAVRAAEEQRARLDARYELLDLLRRQAEDPEPARNRNDRATLALDRLREFRENSFLLSIKPVAALAAVCVTLAGTGLGWLAGVPAPALQAGGVLTLVLLFVLVFAARAKGRRAGFYRRLRADWPEPERLPPEDGGLARFFLNEQTAYLAGRAAAERRAAEIRELERATVADEAVFQELNRARQGTGEALRTCLAAAGALNRDELLLRQNEIGALKAERTGLIEKIQRRYPDQDFDSLKKESRRRLEAYEEAGIPTRVAPEETLRRLRARKTERTLLVENLVAAERAQLIAVEGLSGEMTGSLGGLPGEIVAAERRIGELEARLGELDLARQASALAGEFFAEMAADSAFALQALAGELAALYSEIFGGGGGLRLEGLELKHAFLEDAGGQLRALEACSTGTRDAFFLAARLVLAARTNPQAPLMVLDEPFLALDIERERAVIEFLALFQARYGWQFVFFTKEKRICEIVSERFPVQLTHDLTRMIHDGPATTESRENTARIIRARTHQ